ncbi:MAG TPA: O-antigen ligase family protein [Chthoniobacterales bacterium]|nr:O-antigen ligase family protein [Chthoniobacterales bacterium]
MPVLFLAAAFATIQVLIGGTRLLFSLPAYGLLAIMTFVALFSWHRRRPDPNHLCIYGTALFMGYILLRAFVSPAEYLARADIYSVLGGLLVYFFAGYVFTEAKARIYFLVFLMAIAMAHVWIGFIQFRNDDNFMPISWLKRYDYERRASGFYVCPNHLAGLLEVLGVFGLSIACWSRYPMWVKLVVGYVAAVCYFGLVLTGSRGGYLSTIASLVVFGVLSLWLTRRSGAARFWRISALGAAAAIILAIGVVFLVGKNDFLTKRAQNVFETDNMRMDLWPAAIKQWQLNPLFGTGSGSYLYYGRMFRTERMQVDPVRAHNDYLDLLAEYGAAGGVLLLVFLAVHARAAWKNLARLAPKPVILSGRVFSNSLALQVGAIAAVSAYIVHSGFDFNLHIPANVLLMAFVFAIFANPGSERYGTVAPRNWANTVWRLVPVFIAIIIAVQCYRLIPGEYFAERARTALRREHAGTATRYAERGLEVERSNPNLYDYLGRAHLIRGDARSKPEEKAWYYRRALTAFKDGYKLAPLDEDFPLQLGYAYDKLGRFNEAEWMYYEARMLDPKSIWVKYFYEQHLELWRTGKNSATSGSKTGR